MTAPPNDSHDEHSHADFTAPQQNGTGNENDHRRAGRWDAVLATLPRVPKQLRAQETIRGLLDAAEKAVAECGLERFTTGDVARIAGVSIGSVYNYFDDRVAILDAIRPHRHDATHTLDAIRQRLDDARTIPNPTSADYQTLITDLGALAR